MIDKGNFTADEVEEEFKELVDESWQWQVKQVSPTEFTLVFPSKELLRMAMRGGGLLLPITGYRAAVTAVTGDPRASETLEVVWLKLWDVPEPLRDEKLLLASTLELGFPLEVDLASLGDASGPVRMKFGCKVPVQFKSKLTIFVNLQGFMIRVEQEVAGKAKGSLPSPPPPPNQKKDEDSDKGLNSSSDEGTVDSDSRKAREKRAKANANSSADKSKVGKGGKPTEDTAVVLPLPEVLAVEAATEARVQVRAPLSPGSAPSLDLPKTMFSQYGSNLTEEGHVFKTLGAIVAAAQADVRSAESGAQDVMLMDAPPCSNISEAFPPSLAEVTDSADNRETSAPSSNSRVLDERRSKKNHDRPARVQRLPDPVVEVLDSPEATHRAPSPASNLGSFLQAPVVAELTAPVARGIRSKAVTVETLRKSDRVAKEADGPMLDRAVRLAADKNDSTSKTGSSGKNLDPIFAILQDLPDSHLLSVASDSCVIFPSVAGPPSQSLSLIRSNELAQAALAKTRDQIEQNLIKAKAQDLAVTEAQSSQAEEAAGAAPNSGAAGVVGSTPLQQVVSQNPPLKAQGPGSRRRAKSVAPQGRRPVTRQARAEGMEF